MFTPNRCFLMGALPILTLVSALTTAPAVAGGFAVYDARTQSLAGTSVAMAEPQQAVFYNPAILALTDGHEKNTRKGVIYFPTLTANASSNVEHVADILDAQLDVQLTDAIDTYNTDPSTANAQQVLDVSADLDQAIVDLGEESVDAAGFFGLVVSEPGDRNGGSFYIGIRSMAVGVPTVAQSDLELLAEYRDAMQLVVDGGIPDVSTHPSLFDDSGNLIDPNDAITSSADIGTLVIAEWGVGAAKEFTFWGQKLALGITPKVQRIKVYRDNLSYGNTSVNYVDEVAVDITMNLDVGIAYEWGDYWRFGLTGKDLVAQQVISKNGFAIDLEPSLRAGAMYQRAQVAVGLDVDVIENPPLISEKASQNMSLGFEYRPAQAPFMRARLGYRQDLAGTEGSDMTIGIGANYRLLTADLGYSFSGDRKAASVQFGVRF